MRRYSHHLIKPVACTPVLGREKGQMEHPVGGLRERMFRSNPRIKSLAKLKAWLEVQCVASAVLATWLSCSTVPRNEGHRAAVFSQIG